MALTQGQFQALLDYCRMEDPTPEERSTLEALYAAAEGYLEGAGISRPKEGTPRRAQYDLAVHFMVLRDFDLRDAQVSGTVSDNPAFRRMLTQLTLTEPAGEEE